MGEEGGGGKEEGREEDKGRGKQRIKEEEEDRGGVINCLVLFAGLVQMVRD